MLLQLCKLGLLPLLLYLFRLSFTDWVSVVKPVLLRIQVDMVAALRLRFTVEIDFEEAALHLLAIHLYHRLLRALMLLKVDVGEAFRLLRLPVVGNANCFDLPKPTESVSNVIFLEAVGQAFDK